MFSSLCGGPRPEHRPPRGGGGGLLLHLPPPGVEAPVDVLTACRCPSPSGVTAHPIPYESLLLLLGVMTG